MSLKDAMPGGALSAATLRQLGRDLDTFAERRAESLADDEWFLARITGTVSGGFSFVEQWYDGSAISDKTSGRTNSASDPAVSVSGSTFATGDKVLIRRSFGAGGFAWEAISATAAAGAGVTGSGTLNTVPRWTSSSTIGNSFITVSGVGFVVTIPGGGQYNVDKNGSVSGDAIFGDVSFSYPAALAGTYKAVWSTNVAESQAIAFYLDPDNERIALSSSSSASPKYAISNGTTWLDGASGTLGPGAVATGGIITNAGSGSFGTVTSVTGGTSAGVTVSVASGTTTPAISITLGAITPASVAATGDVTAAGGAADLTSSSGNGRLSLLNSAGGTDVTLTAGAGNVLTTSAGLTTGGALTVSSGGANITGTITASDGSGIAQLNASNLSTGTAPTARLGTGTADATTFLRGDGTWAAVSGGINQLTGDVTAGPGSGSQAATIATGAVTNAKLATVATATFKGRTTAGTGAPEDLTATQATAILNTFTSSLKGLVPSSGGGTTNFLRADGTFAAPASTLNITGLTAGDPETGDEVPVYSLTAAANRKVEVAELTALAAATPPGRLTLSASEPSAIVDMTSTDALYYLSGITGSDRIRLWDGTRYVVVPVGLGYGLSHSGAWAANTVYDLFAFYGTATVSATNTGTDVLTTSGATPWGTGAAVFVSTTAGGLTANTVYYWRAITATTGTLHTSPFNALANVSIVDITGSRNGTVLRGSHMERTAWGATTARTTGLTIGFGQHYRTGDRTRLYLGTVCTPSGSTSLHDTIGARCVWNMYNRRLRPLRVTDTIDSWTYAVSAWRYANNSSANRVQLVRGLDEDAVTAMTFGQGLASNVIGWAVGVGLDSSTTNSAQYRYEASGQTATSGAVVALARYTGFPGIGYRYLAWVEYARAGIATIFGDAGTVTIQSGLSAEVWA